MAKLACGSEDREVGVGADRYATFLRQREHARDVGCEHREERLEGLSELKESLDGLEQGDGITDVHVNQATVIIKGRETSSAI